MLLLWGRGLGQMQVMQVTYGLATSTEVAYFTYIYATVSGEEDSSLRVMIMRIPRRAVPEGDQPDPGCAAAGQVPVRCPGPAPRLSTGVVTGCHENITIIISRSNQVCSYRDLNYISLAMVTAATAVSFLLPPVPSTIYFHSGPERGVDIRVDLYQEDLYQ